MPCNKAGRNRYNHTLSETYKAQDSDELSVTFGTAELTGKKAIDTFHIGPCVVKNQTFNMIQEESGDTFVDLPLEGIVGLGFPSLHASSDLAFFDNVIKQKVLAHNEFAFSMNSDGTSSILWGGVDPKLFVGELRMFPVTQAHYWAIDVHEVKVGNAVVDMGAKPGRTPKLIFDSGTTLFASKQSILDQLTPSENRMKCSEVNRLPKLVFKLKDAAGHPFELDLTGSEYTTKIPETTSCSTAFMEVEVPEEYGPAILVGETFMQNYFTLFDRGDGTDKDARIGFARAPHNPRVIADALHGQKATPKRLMSRQRPNRRVNVASNGLSLDDSDDSDARHAAM
jgi:pepsin A